MLRPTLTTKRYTILDILRGFALLGVILANMASHSGYFFLSDTQKNAIGVSTTDHNVEWLLHFLVDGKFYSLFSMLFGIGFALQMKNAEEKLQSFAGRYRRRLIILFVIGVLHAILFFVGDILTVYALVGLLLFLFRKASNKTILTWALLLLVLPIVQYLFYWLPNVLNHSATISQAAVRPPFFDIIIRTYQTGSFSEIIQTNIGGLIFGRYPDLFFTGRFFRVLGMFLIGFYVTRRMLFATLEERKPFLRKVLLIGAVVGLPCNFVLAKMMETGAYYGLESTGIIQPLVYAYGVPALSLSYAAGIALLYTSKQQKILSIFKAVGRMALTNYLMQSVICSLIFMNYGFGFYAQIAPLHLVLIGLSIYIFQVIFSYVWLLYFQFGPAEWLWRCLTYKQWLPMRKLPDTVL
ncbi:MAG: DUF418 domain-containing protein [Ferruginibacter sp.]